MPTPLTTDPATLPTLKPYLFHGIHFDKVDGEEAIAECPYCNRGERKFSVNIHTGEHRCFSCDFHGGHTTFLRWLFDESDKRTPPQDAEKFKIDRGLIERETLSYWSCAVSVISRAWIVAGYNLEGNLVQLYKRIWIKDDNRWELRPTPSMETGLSNLHGLPLFDQACQTVYLCEGPWDAMALWESLRMAKSVEGRLEFTPNPRSSLVIDSSVLAVANCGAVGEPFRKYAKLFQGRRAVLCFDNDHSKERDGRLIEGSGLTASKRAAAILAGVASEIWWLNWPQDTSDGFDVRDALTKA